MRVETREYIKEQLKIAEANLEIMRKDIVDAKKAGIDVKEQEKAFADLSHKIALLKSVYLK